MAARSRAHERRQPVARPSRAGAPRWPRNVRPGLRADRDRGGICAEHADHRRAAGLFVLAQPARHQRHSAHRGIRRHRSLRRGAFRPRRHRRHLAQPGLCGDVRGGFLRCRAGHCAGAERRDAATRPGAWPGALALGDVPGGDGHRVLVLAQPQLRRADRAAGAAGPGQRGHRVAVQRLGAVLGGAGVRLAYRAAGQLLLSGGLADHSARPVSRGARGWRGAAVALPAHYLAAFEAHHADRAGGDDGGSRAPV
ncbi:hypothetical protein D3C71_1422560 [compost metagenome]